MSCIHSACEFFYSDCGDIEGVRPYCHFDSADEDLAGIITPCHPKQRYSADFETFGDFLDEVGIDYEICEDGTYILNEIWADIEDI